ncbi:peroxiredoxin [Tsuneonella mangrovi]|uniref:peroxiredoxin n=1 Tax=Tsuneonella mangrovi TaxID=1982042 RepID=UPI000BA2527D|nr:peroxiredoxin [Tsuneonella mangrovi]
MNRIVFAALAGVALAASPARAELPVGASAPTFATQAALGGKAFAFNLKAALAKGPVVLYFFPKAFTPGCTLEAHAFAEATPEFEKLGATIIGLSNDNLDELKKFSVLECRNKFPVGAATPAIDDAYDVHLVRDGKDTGLTSRTSYVIDQSGKIVLVHSDMDYKDHVKLTLAAVKKLAQEHH